MNSFEKINKKTATYAAVEKILFWLIFLFSWVLFALNSGNVDFKNYENAYDMIGEGQNNGYFEFLFLILVKLGNLFGLSYQMFLVAVATITLLIFAKAVRNFTDNMLFTYGLFIVYPLVFDIVQYRNFIAYAVCLYGLKYLLKETVTQRDILKYTACVIIGALLHLSSIIYILFLLTVIKSNKKVFIISLGFSAVMIAFLAFPQVFTELLKVIGLSKYARYDVDGNFSTFIQYLAVYIMFFVLGVLSLNGNYKGRELKLMIVVLMFIPFILFNGTAARFFRNTFVIFYGIILNNLPIIRGSRLKVKNFLIFMALFATVAVVFVMQLGSGLYFETVLKPVLRENLLF